MKKLLLVFTLVITTCVINASNVSNEKIATNHDWGSYGGYQLGNDGCYHHGTFYWSGNMMNAIFVSDNGCNNSGECSVGFEDYCMDDNEFSGLC